MPGSKQAKKLKQASQQKERKRVIMNQRCHLHMVFAVQAMQAIPIMFYEQVTSP